MSIEALPPVLYKFMPASYDGGKTILPILKGGHARFTQPQGMNDPYEIQGGFRDETDYRSYFELYRNQWLKDAQKSRTRGQRQKIPLHRLVGALKAIEQSGDFENGKMAELALKNLQKKLQNYGILSLSANWCSSAMWSHYASVHTGVCVGFDPAMRLFHRSKKEGILSLRKVHYCDERAPLAIGSKELQVPNDLFFRKSSDWSYENEWRVIARFSDLPEGASRRNGFHNNIEVITLPIDLECVTEILLGSRSEPAVEEAALEFARKSSRSVNVFRMSLSRYSFRMERIGPL